MAAHRCPCSPGSGQGAGTTASLCPRAWRELAGTQGHPPKSGQSSRVPALAGDATPAPQPQSRAAEPQQVARDWGALLGRRTERDTPRLCAEAQHFWGRVSVGTRSSSAGPCRRSIALAVQGWRGPALTAPHARCLGGGVARSRAIPRDLAPVVPPQLWAGRSFGTPRAQGYARDPQVTSQQ